MFRNLFYSILALSLLAIPVAVFAQEEESGDPMLISTLEEEVTVPIAPDSPFYFFTSIIEGIDLLLTFDEDVKLDKELLFAERRVAEMDMVAADGDTELLDKLQAKYEKHIQNAERIAAKNQEREQEMVQKIVEAQEKHMNVLKDVADRVPEQAKESIDRVIEKTETRFENANTDNSQSDSGASDNGQSGNDDAGAGSDNGNN
jgi:hypothetical protein